MAEYTRVELSDLETDGGEPLLVTQTASAGNSLHTTEIGTAATIIDEITLFALNNDSQDHTVNIQFGGTAARNLMGPIAVPSGAGAQLILAGACLSGTGAAGRVVRIYADSANKIIVWGWVSRYTA